MLLDNPEGGCLPPLSCDSLPSVARGCDTELPASLGDLSGQSLEMRWALWELIPIELVTETSLQIPNVKELKKETGRGEMSSLRY